MWFFLLEDIFSLRSQVRQVFNSLAHSPVVRVQIMLCAHCPRLWSVSRPSRCLTDYTSTALCNSYLLFLRRRGSLTLPLAPPRKCRRSRNVAPATANPFPSCIANPCCTGPEAPRTAQNTIQNHQKNPYPLPLSSILAVRAPFALFCSTIVMKVLACACVDARARVYPWLMLESAWKLENAVSRKPRNRIRHSSTSQVFKMLAFHR